MHLKLFLGGLTILMILQSVLLSMLGGSVGMIVVAGIITLVLAQLLQLVVVSYMVARETQQRRVNEEGADQLEKGHDAEIQPMSSQ